MSYDISRTAELLLFNECSLVHTMRYIDLLNTLSVVEEEVIKAARAASLVA